MLERTSFRGTSYEKHINKVHYFTLIDARENQHPMKYGQLVEKVINSS
jgi:hypothetical protein